MNLWMNNCVGHTELWVHTHRFYPADGGTLMTDEVRYRLPFFPAGEAAYPLVKWQLARIFAFRRQAITTLLSRYASGQCYNSGVSGRV